MYTPFYAVSEFERLLKFFRDGSLDSLTGSGSVKPGMRNCEVVNHGVRAEGLVSRYTCDQVMSVFRSFGAGSEKLRLYGALILAHHVKGVPLEDLGRAIGCDDCHVAQGLLCEAQDQFMRVLLAL